MDGGSDSVQPKGRWAQRFDQNLAFKSQLDLSQIDEDSGKTCFSSHCFLSDSFGFQSVYLLKKKKKNQKQKNW